MNPDGNIILMVVNIDRNINVVIGDVAIEVPVKAKSLNTCICK